MNHCRHGQCEGTQGDSQRCVQCYGGRRAAQPNVFVPYVRRERGGADHPGREPPRDSDLIGSGSMGERREGDAGDKVHDAHD